MLFRSKSAVETADAYYDSGGPRIPLPNFEEFQKTVGQFYACGSFKTEDGHPSQIQEAFADYFGAEIHRLTLNDPKLNAQSNRKKELASEYILDLASQNHCFGSNPSINEEQLGKLQRAGCAIPKTSDSDFELHGNDSHPLHNRRADKIYLAVPEIREALGCPSSEKVKHCE